MTSTFLRLLVVVFALSSMVHGAHARGKLTTKYKFYTVSGSTAASLHSNMTVPGGFFSSERVYANITMKPQFQGTFKQGRTCKLKNFGINGQFVIRLPRLRPGTRLPAGLSRKFKSFVAYVRKHELTHRSIWTRCLRSAESRIKRLKYKSCNRLDEHAAKIIKSEWSKCERQNIRFDRLEAKRLVRLPLVRAAFKKAKRVKPGRKKTIRRHKKRRVIRNFGGSSNR